MKTRGGFLMSQVRHLSSRTFERMLKDSGIDAFNGAQGRILYVLWEHERLTISQIGKLTSLAKTTLSSMLGRMEEAKLIRRIPDVENRRQVFVEITDVAKQYREDYERVSRQINELFYLGFSENEIAHFEGYLERILKNLESE